YPDSDIRFDFAPIAACDELTSLKLGPCGYLAPTTNFSLIPRLLTKLMLDSCERWMYLLVGGLTFIKVILSNADVGLLCC
ncbi:unnamed protein product, partial [Allacma fusca]